MAKILAVDDRPTNREYLTTLLGYGGHQVLEAGDGAEALAIAKAERPDLIIADILMPTMDGYELVHQIRADAAIAQTPVVFYTAHYRQQEAQALALQCGVSCVLTKPAEPQAIISAVDAALGIAPPPFSPLATEDFDREHKRLVTDKLAQKANELKRANDRLTALVDLGLQLGSELDLQRLLQNLGHAARDIIGARYAIVTISDDGGPGLRYVFTSGMNPETAAHLGSPDQNADVLRPVLGTGRCVRLQNPGGDPTAIGLSTSYPLIHALLAAPIESPTRIYGCLSLVDKIGVEAFSEEDERLAAILAAQVGRIYHNGSLYADTLQHASDLEREVAERKRAQAAAAAEARLSSLAADIAIALASTTNLRDMLQHCAQSIVNHLEASFARIWTLNEAEDILELQASAGKYTQLDGSHGRVPVGKFKIGLIAREKKPHLTNEVLGDPRIGDPEWAKREGMVAFAGYPLLIEDRLVGVVALFATHRLPANVLESLKAVANNIAVGIDRKLAEAGRDQLLARLRMQIDRMPLGYLLFDADFRIIDWNGKAEEIFGYQKDEVLGTRPPFEKLLPATAWPGVQAILERLRSGDMAAHAATENRTKDGRTITCHWSNTPLHDADGKFAGVISLTQNITESMRLEEQFRRSQERLQRVVSSSPAVIYSLAVKKGKFCATWVSDNMLDMMGFPAQEALEDTWYEKHVHPEDSAWVFEGHKNILISGHLVQEYRFRHRDGNDRWIRDEKRLVSKPGEPVEIVGSWSDITARKQLEEQYHQAQKMEAFGRLAGGVAHDFNNLLTIIMGYCEVALAKLRVDDPLCFLLKEIHKAGERATSLTRQLLAFSRKQVLAPVVLDLNLVLADMEKMLCRLIGEDIAFAVSPGNGLWRVKADPGQMEQVIMNIVVNARDAMPQGGKILIETKNVELDEGYAQKHPEARADDHVLLAISDTGCGMDASIRARIFEPFFTTKGPTKGTGLGLATVFGIVKQSGGHIEVYSEVGHGTTFKIYLPRDRSGEPTAAVSRIYEPVRGGSETILLVEDEDSVRKLAATVLQQRGYTVLDARHGGEALVICETSSTPIDLMITDVVMPHFSGRQLAERVAKPQPNMKVLFMSGYTDDAIVHHGVLESGLAFLQKPFAPEALARKVREVLDGARRRISGN